MLYKAQFPLGCRVVNLVADFWVHDQVRDKLLQSRHVEIEAGSRGSGRGRRLGRVAGQDSLVEIGRDPNPRTFHCYKCGLFI